MNEVKEKLRKVQKECPKLADALCKLVDEGYIKIVVEPTARFLIARMS